MARTRINLEKHIQEEHHITPVQTYLREIVYGGTDGIVTTFAVVAGFTGAQIGANITGLSVVTVLLFGLANLFADATSMALGNFLSLRSDQDIYRAARTKERHEVRHNKQFEYDETVEILIRKGFNENQAKTLADIYSTNEEYWLDFMMNHELEIEDTTKDDPIKTGLATFISFLIFGCIPLIPYLIFPNNKNVFLLSLVSALIALVLLGITRVKATGEKPARSILEILLLGSIAGTVAFIVGSLFNH